MTETAQLDSNRVERGNLVYEDEASGEGFEDEVVGDLTRIVELLAQLSAE